MPPKRRDAPSTGPAPSVRLANLSGIRLRDLALRFALGAVIAVLAGLLSKLVGPRFGGMFLAFPAILPASLTLIQRKEGTRRADSNAYGAVLGGLALGLFAGVAEALFGHLAGPLVLLVALAGWLVGAGLLYWMVAYFHPAACQDDS